MRSVDQQHERLQLAIEQVGNAVAKSDARATEAALLDQRTQALTLIALELRELRTYLGVLMSVRSGFCGPESP